MVDEHNGWAEHKELVLSELSRLHTSLKEFRDKMEEVYIEVALLKSQQAFKASMWKIMLPALVSLGIALLVWKLST